MLLALVILTAACGSKTHEPAPPTTSTSAPTRASTSTSSSVSPATTTTPAPSSRALYPVDLPDGIQPGVLWISTDPKIDSGYTQSYYGASNAAGPLPELVIEERPARLMEALVPTKFAGRDVMMWRSNTPSNPVIAVTAKLSGRDVTLVSYALSERDLGTVLNGLQPRSNGYGWETGVLPARLRLFGEGDQTPEPSDVYYLLKFGPVDRPTVQISVSPGALLPEDTCICNPGLRRSLTATTINGKPAVVIDRSGAAGVTGRDFEVDWQYAPDIVVGVSVHELDQRDALRITSSIAAADPVTWAALRCINAAAGGGTCSPELEVPTSN